MAMENRKTTAASLSLTMKRSNELVERFFSLLRPGFTVRARLGCSIRELLCSQFGLDPEYLKSRITTIFLNHKAIDDPETSRVGPGATLALSAAMPGLVGATMRCGGYYAAMRSSISHHESAGDLEANSGEIRIKLFNLLMPELSPGFLHEGVILSSRDLVEFLAGQTADFWEGCSKALLDGKAVDPISLGKGEGLPGGDEPVGLSVFFEE